MLLECSMFLPDILIYIDCLYVVITGEESVQSGNKDEKRDKRKTESNQRSRR